MALPKIPFVPENTKDGPNPFSEDARHKGILAASATMLTYLSNKENNDKKIHWLLWMNATILMGLSIFIIWVVFFKPKDATVVDMNRIAQWEKNVERREILLSEEKAAWRKRQSYQDSLNTIRDKAIDKRREELIIINDQVLSMHRQLIEIKADLLRNTNKLKPKP